MQIAWYIDNAANHVIAKTKCQSYFKQFEILYCRKPQAAIRTDWKIYPCIFYHFSIDTFSIFNDFSSGSLTFDIFNNTTFFDTMQKTGESNYAFTYANLGTTLSPLWKELLISCSFISLIFFLLFLSFHTSVNIFFLLYFFKHTGWNTLVHLIISLRENQPATQGMLQKEIINCFRKLAWQNTKLLLKMIISDLRDTYSNTALTEFG